MSNEFEQARWSAVERALDILDTPRSEVSLFFDVEVVRTSQQVLDDEGLTTEDVLDDPTLLLRGDVYAGGSTTTMDPFHPATLPLIELRFAGHGVEEPGGEEVLAAAMDRAAGSMSAHGVPREIARVSTIGVNNFQFEPTDVFVLMPDCLSSGWTIAPQPPMAPLSATFLIMGALAGVPADHEARPTIEKLVRFIAIPGLEPQLLKTTAAAVATALLQGPQLSGDDLT